MSSLNTSLHSGSIDSVQNSEAELQNFEAVARAEALALKWGSAPNPANFEKFDQTFPLYFLLKTENFRASARKFTFNFAPRANINSAQADINLPQGNINSASADINSKNEN